MIQQVADSTNPDPRVPELQALALEEGLRLPMPINLLLWLEDRGKLVDLRTGKITEGYVVMPTPSGRALSDLLEGIDEEV